MFFQKILSAVLLTAFSVWFFASVPAIFYPVFSQVQDIPHFSTEHLSYKYNAAGVLFQEISFGGVVERFIVHFAENLVFSLNAEAKGIEGRQSINLFSLLAHDFKEKLFSPGFSLGYKNILLGGVLILLIVGFCSFSKEFFAILSILARSRFRNKTKDLRLCILSRHFLQ